MNLALTDPFILAQDYPEALTGKLSMIAPFAFFTFLLTNLSRIWTCNVSQIQP